MKETRMKARKVYVLVASLAAMIVCANAFAQGGPPQDDQNGPPPRPPMDGQMGGPGMRPVGPPMEPLIMRPDVCKELKLSEDQVKKIQALLPPPPHDRDGGGQGFRSGPPQGDNQRPEGRLGDNGGPRRMGPEAMDDQLANILTDTQMKRLKELRLQRQGAMALMRPDVADQVGLSDDEHEKITGIVDDAMKSIHGTDGERP